MLDNTNTVNLPMFILIISTSLFCAFSSNLKNYADDKVLHKKIPSIYYFANTLVYTVSGSLISLTSTLVTDNMTLWLISAGIGGLIGKKLLIFMVDILVRVFVNMKNLKSDEILKDIKFTDDKNIEKKDTESK